MILMPFVKVPIIVFKVSNFEFIIFNSRVFTYFSFITNDIFNFDKNKTFPDFVIRKVRGFLLFMIALYSGL
jgi:hypothetical protein